MSTGKFKFYRPSAWDYLTAVRTSQTGPKNGIRSVDLSASKYTAESRHDSLREHAKQPEISIHTRSRNLLYRSVMFHICLQIT